MNIISALSSQYCRRLSGAESSSEKLLNLPGTLENCDQVLVSM